ncbi:phosphoenolpyruvate hydrolase family protein [Nakamurella leprariae]|uniref:Phosphoenolpyruvate hydrolase family protein n=1 Tax=Nakamurella leprariae TaxID=2803911 RepID=A0A938YHD2_9ACTN|nr:phosphoenolpyruvate hydrolase family protein [Nakamurella leprariae]MBM9467853.1 phosphoenolpyruvate hydrolase family protein [Nakamurella leprariae]
MQPPVLLAATGDRDVAAALTATGRIDRIVAYHSSFYRQRGLPSVAGLLPWGNANEQTLAMLPGVLDGAGVTPVLATVCANDAIVPPAAMLGQLADAGVRGVVNAPTVGLLTGPVREALEAEQLGMSCEIELIASARGMGLEGWAYVFDPDWAAAALGAGATGLILHLGITGHPGPTGRPPAEVVAAVAAVVAAHLGEAPLLVHGGDLGSPTAAADLLAAIDPTARWVVRGFFGASAFERHAGSGLAAVVADWSRCFTHPIDQEHA